MGAIGLNGAAAQEKDPKERARIAGIGWDRWVPVNGAAIAAHLVGSVLLLGGNKGRIAGQKGVAPAALAKTALTLGAMGATAAARWAGKEITRLGDEPVEGVTEPGASTPPELAEAQKKERILQWAVPASTAALVLMSAKMGEQQRAGSVLQGVTRRFASLR